MSLFELLTTQIVDDEGFYHGHVVLQNQMLAKKAEFEKTFATMLLVPVSSKERQDFLENFETIKSMFFKELERSYFEAQESLAQITFKQKRVKVVGGIAKANADPDDFFVYWVEKPDSFDLEKEKGHFGGILVELAYGSDTLGRIFITKDTTIQILGDIPEG
ncbi:hypothetical protein KKC45_00585 [Patescibacteria group bacterium]|nr:hypothetical protein [Patescibacteria group bacterium]